ncbi:energy-coupling factor ABC transporter ATP-binding protein [Dendrosporobacter sp. 1207_IL3150]|uniref:energy-coupling factor ABC transporter ATP-binding protein n=1 Tax=Dendrosporobacter sp. 1207_IL3150 TaxID=3084054 RepID=UPI002FDB946B
MSEIVIDDLSYTYPKSVEQALEGISLTIESGSFAVLTGFNGSGKTTLCMAIAGAVPHYFGGAMAGNVTVGSLKTTESGICDIANTVGLVMQDYESQLVTLTVEEEVSFGLENRGVECSEIARLVKEALQMVGLSGKERQHTAALSGGQKQRLAIASVLATKPSILVLDDPTSALDPEGACELYELLYQLNQDHGLTIVVVEHDLSLALPYASNFILLENGRIEKKGTPAEVLQYMGIKQQYACVLPELWKLKLGLETDSLCFSDWSTSEEAANELLHCVRSKEAEKSA